MAELLSWMRAYNERAGDGQDLRFYGFDMQQAKNSYRYLLEEARRLRVDTADLEAIWDGDGYSSAFDSNGIAEVYAALEQEIAKSARGEDVVFALHLIDSLQQGVELSKLVDSPDYPSVRDGFMAQNTLWILAQEEKRGNRCIFISGHNGHIEQTGTYGPGQKVMGNLLADKLGESYYAIGTDFFEAEVNLPDGERRMTHTFYSYDPLAKAADACGYDTCWLDFARVPDDAELARSIDEPIMMGSLGEMFSPLMYVLPQTYRVKREPASPYDSMIFVTHAHPTQIKAG
jgi:erythromycin esterase